MRPRLPTPRRVALGSLAFAALALVATCGWSGQVAANDGEAAASLGVLPEFELSSLSGRAVGPDQFSGQVVLYEFWATWCTPCHVQVEILKGIYPQARAAGVEFVAIATGEPEEIVREHLAKSPYPYPVLLDPDERLGTALEVLGLPTLVVVDRGGRIVWRQTGLTDVETLSDALAGAGAELADTAP